MIDLPVLDGKDAATVDERSAGARFWRSKQHLEQSAAFDETHDEEFMPGVSQPPGGTSRRQFMKIMGASMALAGLTGCRKPVEKILPYTRKPEEVIPGIARYYATSMPFRGSVRNLLVQSHEGRPTKVEGNPEHPLSQGASGVFAQASVLNLYDPDRSDKVHREGAEATWQDVADFARNLDATSTRVAVLCEQTSSPTVAALREQMRERFADLRWVDYAPMGADPAEQGLQQAFGRPLHPFYRFGQADVIVSLDADFLSPTEKNYIHNTASFARGRRLERPEDDMSQLYVAESTHSITGGMADNRLNLRASDIPVFAAALADGLGMDAGGLAEAPLTEEQETYLRAMVRDLQEAGIQGLVVAGDTQPPAVHALCAAINDHLGSIGETMMLMDVSEEQQGSSQEQPASQAEQMADLARAMRAGEVDVLLTVGANPVYDAPPDLNFEAALNRVPETIHLGTHLNEMARACRWHVPRAHYLETWGDGRSYDGTLSVIQPLIAPLYDAAHSEVEVLNLLATGLDQAGYDVVREEWRDRIDGSFEEGWRRVLHDGFLPDTQYSTVSASAGSVSLNNVQAPADDGLEVVFRLDPTVLAGRFSNNAWCQELPSPTTKITWDNVAIMSPATAEELDLSAEYDKGQYYVDVIELAVDGRSVTLPVWIHPGHADGSISVAMGYGRDIQSDRAERDSWFFSTDEETDIYGHGALANGVGTNVAPLRSTRSMHLARGAEVRTTGEQYMIATTQDHGALNMEARPLFRMDTKEEFEDNPDFVQDMGELVPGEEESFEEYPELWEDDHPSNQPAFKDDRYYQYQWGMTIDLNTCTGCNACVVACQSENNIQVVGKEQVAEGREMHWLRVDRYFVSEGDDEEAGENPNMVLQPVPCMHCENAPCESVCPVAATVHSPDGTNQMIYNRCVGTRYCSNNCPYKVRHFNFFNWSKTLPTEVQMAQNPNVTMRSRGVMEKCSYCIHRVRETGRRARLEGRDIRDGEVQTACQQACPAEAITFGDLNDSNSKVSREKRNPRRYEMLDELNVKPRTSYLGRVRNPNPRLEETSV